MYYWVLDKDGVPLFKGRDNIDMQITFAAALNAQGVQPSTGDAGLQKVLAFAREYIESDRSEYPKAVDAALDQLEALATVAPQPAPDLALREALECISKDREHIGEASGLGEDYDWGWDAATQAHANIADQALAASAAQQPDERDAVIAELVETLQWADDNLQEINPSNYDHEAVCFMNSKNVEVILGIRKALSRARAVSKTEVA